VIQRQEADDQETGGKQGSYLSIVLAFLLAAAVFVGLFFLTLGAVGPMLLIGCAVFAVVALHYLVWGWWLSRLIRREADEEGE
jgi:hypothetical protein